MQGTADNPVAPDVPHGVISLVIGLTAIFVTLAGCVVSMQWMGLPVGAIGILFASLGVQRLREGHPESVDALIWGLVLNTVAVALNVLLFAFCAAFVSVYFAGIVAMIVAL